MKKRSAKTLGISLALMLVMCVATALLSFSLADETTPLAPATGTEGSFSATKTNIDYIIDNSNNGVTDETGRDLSIFYIVEIGSAANSNGSPLKAMLTEDIIGKTDVTVTAGDAFNYDVGTTNVDTDMSHFVKQVINGWSTQNQTMKPNKISYKYFSVSNLNNEEILEAAITSVGKADLIYVSNDPSSQYKVDSNTTRDIPEDLKLLLSAAATTTGTPFIIDSPTKTQNGGSNGGGTSSKTIGGLAQNVLIKAGYYRNAFAYDTTKSTNVQNYLNRTDANSLWLPISGGKKKANWFVDKDGKTTARVLTISKEGDAAVTNKIKGAIDTSKTYDLANLTSDDAYALNVNQFEFTGTEAEVKAAYNTFFSGKTAYALEGTDFYAFGYSISQDRPDNVIFEQVSVGDNLNLSDYNLGKYDLIILEGDLTNTVMSADDYNMFYSMVYGLQHFVYNSSLATGASQGDGTIAIVTSTAPNYSYVMAKVADANEKARFSNVLVTGKNEMLIYGAATAPSGVKAIADIINNGSYRGSGSIGGSSSNLYTVLEIQPCYPIDYELAKVLQGQRANFHDKARKDKPREGFDDQDIFYYLRHDSVLNDVTSDEISYDGGKTSLTDMESTDDGVTGLSSRGAVQNSNLITADTAVDYYAWELSKAKIAHLTGLDYNKVKVVHMSSVEFNTSRETLKDNYDMIYIGGKNTAIRKAEYITKMGRTQNAAVYNMYFHDGGTYEMDGNYAVLTGNDISYLKYKELMEYVTAGMPLVITKPVALAYYGAKSQGYRQTLLDPDSNMYKLLNLYIAGDAAETVNGNEYYASNKTNVLVGFDPTDQVKIANAGGEYGDTYGGYATVFGGIDKNVYVRKTIKDENNNDVLANVPTGVTPSTVAVNAEELSALMKSTTIGERPKFSLIQSPASYVEGDVSTEIVGNKITFKYDVSSKKTYTVRIYVDDNTNSVFENPSEVLYTGTNNPITLTLPTGFDGGLYWKFEIAAGECSSSTTGLSKVHVQDRNYVNVLQIVPEDANDVKENNNITLMFCTDCQQARGILRGNRYDGGGKYTEHVALNSKYGEGDYNPGGSVPNLSACDTGYTYVANNALGVHEHNFGIVKYDSNWKIGNTVGTDNWQTNWADDLFNEYDVDMDILTTREYEAMVNDAVSKVTSENAATVIPAYQTLEAIYSNYYQIMRNIISGQVNTSDQNYVYLKNKLTSTRSSTEGFAESELNHLFGESPAAYALETAKGGLSQSSDVPTWEIKHSWESAWKSGTLTAGSGLAINAVFTYGNLDTGSFTVTPNDSGKVTYTWRNQTNEGDLREYDQNPDTNGAYKVYAGGEFILNILPVKGQSSGTIEVPLVFGADLSKFLVAQMNLDSYLTALGVAKTSNMDKCTNAELKQEIAYELKYHRYSDFYSLSNSHNDECDNVRYTKYTADANGNITSTTVTANKKIYDEFSALYVPWRDAKAYEQYFYKMYTKYHIYATMKEYNGTYLPDFTEVYSCIVIGVAEAFGGDDITGANPINAIKAYAENDGNTFIFHQTINDSGSTQQLTAGLKELFGQDYNHLTRATTQAAETSTFGTGSSTALPKNVYTPLMYDNRTAAQKVVGSNDYIDPPSITLSPTHRTMVNSGVWGTNEKETLFMYTQSALLHSDTQVPNTHKDFDAADFYTKSFTNRATQTNKGLVTMYPFLIASQLRIGQTHPNTFSTDIEDRDVVVYYTLAGGSTGNQSSLVAADPQDGIDNYWLYSKGSVTYCGAGHSSITGIHVDNNDERRLFINIILNSVKKSVFGPSISVFDPYPETVGGESQYVNKTITMTEEGIYEMTIPNINTIPEFTYMVSVPNTKDEVDEVKIYYDLSANTSGDNFGYVNGTDVLIFNATSNNDTSILKNLYKLISRAINNLQLQETYFAPYGNKYTYIVIAVKTKTGVYTTQRIMVKLAPKLWDLT